MPEITTHKRIARWGHGYGLRLTRDEARRLGVREKSEVEVRVRATDEPLDVESLPKFPMGRHASRDHDKVFTKGEPA